MTTQVTGTVERIAYENSKTGYAVALIESQEGSGLFTAVGNLGGLSVGEEIIASGSWERHVRHGHQFRVTHCQRKLPNNCVAIERYLSSGLIKGVGPQLARRLVAQFGRDTLTIIDQCPERLIETPGVGPSKAGAIQKAWKEQCLIRELLIFMEKYHLPGSLAVQIFRKYGQDSLRILTENPYQLLWVTEDLSFSAIEKLARRLALPRTLNERLQAGLLHVLHRALDAGHLALPTTRLLQAGSQLLNLPASDLIPALAALASRQGITQENFSHPSDPWCWLPPVWESEALLAMKLGQRLKRKAELHPRLHQYLDEFESSLSPPITSAQRQAVTTAAESQVFILTGGPGTGKTATVAAMVRLWERCELIVALASPTGRAAKRLSDITRREATTLHRLLEYSPAQHKFMRDENRPIEADIVLVDEASMLDMSLFTHLIEALPPLAQLVLVGDVNQLPSIGPGQILRDLLESGVVPCVRLTEVFRQAANSAIVTHAHDICHGLVPKIPRPTGDRRSECYFLPAGDVERTQALLLNAVTISLPRRLGLDPAQDIQVLTPVHHGGLGTSALNKILQRHLTAPAVTHRDGGRSDDTFHVGDKVMQTINNYEKSVFNGDLGWIETFDIDSQVWWVRMAERRVPYKASEAHELSLAYAITIHKSQGNEFPAVVIPVMTCFGPILQRNLIYTALTRARTIAVFVGEEAAVAEAIKRNDGHGRHTGLAGRLRALM